MSQFKPRRLGEPYMLIAAGSGVSSYTYPDGTSESVEEIKVRLGYPQLIAWKNERKALNDWVERLRKDPECKVKLVVDSSAYSAWTRGLEIDIDEYISVINDIQDVVYWFAELDKIPGKFGEVHTKQELEEAPEYSWKNFLYMIERVNCPKKIVPIFHMGEDWKYLKQMLEFRFPDGSHVEYIGISPDNGETVNNKIKWYEQVWKIIKESSNPDVLTHNFGCTTVSILEQFPSMSSDSTRWLKYAAYGMILLNTNKRTMSITVSERGSGRADHYHNQPQSVKDEIARICDVIGHGVTVDTLLTEENGGLRQIFNLYALNEWRCNFNFEGNSIFKTELW